MNKCDVLAFLVVLSISAASAFNIPTPEQANKARQELLQRIHIAHNDAVENEFNNSVVYACYRLDKGENPVCIYLKYRENVKPLTDLFKKAGFKVSILESEDYSNVTVSF